MIIVVDSDGFIGSLSGSDYHHRTSRKLLEKLSAGENKLVFPATMLVETVTFLRGRLKLPELASYVLELVNNNKLLVEPVDINVLQEASKFINLKGSKRDTFFDAVVAAIAKKHGADAIFSFDKFYKKNGFKLASEIY